MSHRVQQVESLLKRTISQVLIRDIADPRILGLVSITRVQVSPDLHDAFVYVSVLPEKYEKRTIAGLQHANRHIYEKVKKAVALKTVPHLEFRLDESLKRQAEIDAALHRAQEAAAQAAAAGPQVPGQPTQTAETSNDRAANAGSRGDGGVAPPQAGGRS